MSTDDQVQVAVPEGMTLRDWFAGQALVAILSHPGAGKIPHPARACYEIADEMIEAREVDQE